MHEGSRQPSGEGPLADDELTTDRPIEDPVLADRANPRWGGKPVRGNGAQSLANPDGSPNVLPAEDPGSLISSPDPDDRGTPQDQAARTLEPEIGRDNIREGRGGGTPNPALAEGGDNG